jgi:hypothetical protein
VATAIPDSPTVVATFLAGAGLGLTAATNLFTSEEIPDPPYPDPDTGPTHPTVYVRPAGGPAPSPYFGSGGSDHIFQLSILVRGERDKDPEGWSLARSISDSLQKASIPPFYSVLLRDAQPVFLGRDDHDQPGWSIGLECRFTS